MKLRKIKTEEYIEVPEDGVYPLESAERVDIRPGETRMVSTGLEILANKDDNVFVHPELTKAFPELVSAEEQLYGRSYSEIKVKVHNPTDTLIPLWPGNVLGVLTYDVKKTATLETTATFSEEEPEDNSGE